MDAIPDTAGLDTLIDCYEASTIFGVKPATIRQWAHRGKIQAAGMDPDGRKLYRYGQVAAQERKSRQAAGRAA